MPDEKTPVPVGRSIPLDPGAQSPQAVEDRTTRLVERTRGATVFS